MEDQKIIELFFARDEQALLEADRSYGGYCFAVARSILGSDRDAEEVVSDTMLRAWNSIPPQKPRNLKLYLAGIARNAAMSAWRAQNAEKRGGGQLLIALDELGECVSGTDDVSSTLDKQELGDAITRFLRKQKERDRGVFVRRYFYLEDTGAIARRFAIREENVLQILSRTRRKLKLFLIQEGYEL